MSAIIELQRVCRDYKGASGTTAVLREISLLLAYEVTRELELTTTTIETPLTTMRLAELCLEAGLPPGVVNVVTGTGEEAGAALTACGVPSQQTWPFRQTTRSEARITTSKSWLTIRMAAPVWARTSSISL